MSGLSHRPNEPPYYIVDCRIFDLYYSELVLNAKLTIFSLFYFFYSQKIWVNGCMTEARQTLFKHVMPLLLICALVSLVVGLIELLLLLCAVCFADHIKVRSLRFHSKLLIGSWVHNLGWSKIYSKF